MICYGRQACFSFSSRQITSAKETHPRAPWLPCVQVSSAVPRDCCISPGLGGQRGEGSGSCGDHGGARGAVIRGDGSSSCGSELVQKQHFEQDFSQTGTNKLRLGVLASVWGPCAPEPRSGQGGMEGDLAEGPSKRRRQCVNPKVTLQTSPSGTPRPIGGAGVPADTGHQSGKGTGAPFPASTAAAPASFASDLPNYS